MKIRTVKVSWNINIATPTVPNFFFEMGREDGNGGKYPISDFPDSVLEEIGKAWTENLKTRAGQMLRAKTP